MKKIYLLVASSISVGLLVGSTVAVNAADKSAKEDKVMYVCWSGKTISTDKETMDKKMKEHPMPDSAEYKLGIEKSKELRAIPGVASTDGQGGEIINIDDDNPAIQKVMKKYEAKEFPQCQ